MSDGHKAAACLTSMLDDTLRMLRTARPGAPIFPAAKDGAMATNLGGKDAGLSFRAQMDAMRKKREALMTEMGGAFKDHDAMLDEAAGVIKEVRADTAEMRAAFRGDSNEPPKTE
jgi:hypothetical protein